MAEKTEPRKKPFENRIPEETRQHLKAAREEFRKSMEGILPPGFVEHHQSARKEMLLAWRSLIDAKLEGMESKSK